MQERKRLFIETRTGTRERIDLVKWAAQNGYDTLVFSLAEKLSHKNALIKLADRYELNIEAGGHDLSLLLPRKLFMFNRELFRMEQGKRKKQHHFCPTNPKTMAIIAEQALSLFTRMMPFLSQPCVFNLLPDKGFETTWCACPACRAFSPTEQNTIAVNTAADVLAKIDPKAMLSFHDYGTEPDVEAVSIAPRENMFKLPV